MIIKCFFLLVISIAHSLHTFSVCCHILMGMAKRKEKYEEAEDRDNFYYARDGEVVVRKRERSRVWQATYKVDNKWVRISTKERDLDNAIAVACEQYDKARFLRDANVEVVSKRFKSVADASLKKLQELIDSGLGKVIHKDYVRAINNSMVDCLRHVSF